MPETFPPLAAFGGRRRVPAPVNEPVKSYAPGSPEKAEVKARLKQMAAETVEIPLVIGGREVRTGDLANTVMPHDHGHVVARWHRARRSKIPPRPTSRCPAQRTRHCRWSRFRKLATASESIPRGRSPSSASAAGR